MLIETPKHLYRQSTVTSSAKFPTETRGCLPNHPEDKRAAVSSLYVPGRLSCPTTHQGAAPAAPAFCVHRVGALTPTQWQTALPSPGVLPPFCLAWPFPPSGAKKELYLLPSLLACGTFISPGTMAAHHKAYSMRWGKNSIPGGEHSKASTFLCSSLFWLFTFLSYIVIMTACHMLFFFFSICLVLVGRGLKKGFSL